MRYDSGEATFYRKSNQAANGLMPVAKYDQILTSCFSEQTVGIYRYNQAKQNDAQLDFVLRVPQTYSVRVGDAATLLFYSHVSEPGEIFKVYQVQQTQDDDGLPVTDVSLERYGGIDAAKIKDSLDGAGGSD